MYDIGSDSARRLSSGRRRGASGAPAAALQTLAAIGVQLPAIAAWLVPFGLVVYLSLRGGGFEDIVHSEAGLLIWWLVLLGALTAILPAARLGRGAWIALGLLAGFALWSAIAISWSESSERSVDEVARIAVYVGAFALLLAIQGPRGLRHTAGAVAAVVALVAALALLSRLHPAWFPTDETALVLEETRSRLSYPLNYWNGLAALIAIGTPLLLHAATAARALGLRALAAAALPMMALTAFYTFSRGGLVAIGIGLAVFVLLRRERLELVPTLAIAAAGSALLVGAATRRDELESGLMTSAADQQRDEMLLITIAVVVAVAIGQLVISRAERRAERPLVRVPLRWRRRVLAGALIAAVAAIAISGAPGKLKGQWDEFREPAGPGFGSERLLSSSGNGRWQWWGAAIDAAEDEPLSGIGPGTYEFWWNRTGTIPGGVVDSHSLYLETLAETGPVGLALVLGLVGAILVAGTRRALRRRDRDAATLAAATAGASAFAVAAALDWVWELPVLPVAFLALAAAILGADASPWGSRGNARPWRSRAVQRAALAVGAIACVALLGHTLLGGYPLRQSEADGAAGELGVALEHAEDAVDARPYAAAPRLQEALVLEAGGSLEAASLAAEAAVSRESTNYRTWLVLGRIERARGETASAEQALDRALELAPEAGALIEEIEATRGR